MTNWLDELSNSETEKAPSATAWTDELLGGGSGTFINSPIAEDNGEVRVLKSLKNSTSEVSTITGKPVAKYVSDYNEKPAKMKTYIKAGTVDDVNAKIKIFAQDRGLPESRYGVHDGEIVYKADDGYIYQETPEGLGTKRFIGDTVAHSPSIVLGVVGATLGPGTSALGAMGGEGIRKSIGGLIYNEPQTTKGNIADMAVEGVLDLAGYSIGKLISKPIDIMSGSGAKIAEAARSDLASIDADAALNVIKKGKKYGVDLFIPQATDSPRLVNKFKLLGDMEKSADIIKTARQIQSEQIETSAHSFLDDISTIDKLKASQGIVNASKKAVDSMVNIRKAKASPIYKKAFDEAPQVDVKPVVEYIDNQLKTAKAQVRVHLLKAKKILADPDLPIKEKGLIVDQSGKPFNPSSETWDTTLKGLHDSKIALDDAIATAKNNRTGNVAHNYSEIKKLLINQMDSASPDYKRARQVFSDYSTVIDEQTKKTLVGNIAKLEGDNVLTAQRKLLASTWTSPETVVKAKRIIQKQNPKAWEDSLATFIRDTFEGIKETADGDIANLGGKFYKGLFGSKKQRNILKAAMKPEQYSNFKDFMEVMRRSGIGYGKDSATATRQISANEMQRTGESKLIMAWSRPLYTYQRLIGDRVNDTLFGKYQKDLAEALLSPKSLKYLKQAKSSRTQKQMLTSFSTFLTLVQAGEFKRNTERVLAPEQPIAQ